MEHLKPRVLAIDDSRAIHLLLKRGLAGQGLELQTFADPVQGVAHAIAEPPDLVLLDVDMPGMTGIEACRALKDESATAHVPVVFLTGSEGVECVVAALDAGAVDYISKPFDPAELQARVRAALRTKRYQDLLTVRAQVDALTGLRNRAYFESRLAEEIAAARRYDRRVALVMADVDRFKSINDRFGHPVGDRVLQRVGDVLLAATRTTDAPCRYGGEEFALILTETDYAAGLLTAERIRKQIEAAAIECGAEPLRFTASFGVAATELFDDPTREGLLSEADRALYAAKHGGRNRVVGAVPA